MCVGEHQTSSLWFRKDLSAAGLPTVMITDEKKRVRFVFHSTRKSFVSSLNAAGVDDDLRQILMGHARKGVTNRHYTAKELQRLKDAVATLPL